MNKKAIDAIIENLHQILNESGIDADITEETELSRDMGVDSLGIVNLILGIEEDLEIDLDDYLVEIRNAKSVSDLIEIVNKAYSEQNK